MSDFNCWISLSLSDSFSPKLGLRPKLIQKLKSLYVRVLNFLVAFNALAFCMHFVYDFIINNNNNKSILWEQNFGISFLWATRFSQRRCGQIYYRQRYKLSETTLHFLLLSNE